MRRRVLFVLPLCLPISCISSPCQDTNSAIVRANREVGISFAPSLIAYREYTNSGSGTQDSEHGWISGVGVNASVPFHLGLNWLTEGSYEYNDGSSKHWSLNGNGPQSIQYRAPFRSNDAFIGIGPTFIPTSRFSLTPEGEVEYP